jgi:hypothetical protein
MSKESVHGIESMIHAQDTSLHQHPSVEIVQTQKKIRGEETSEKPAEKLADFFDTWTEILEASQREQARVGSTQHETILDRMKQLAHELYVIKEEDIPESWFTMQQQIARNEGRESVEITPEMRAEFITVIQEDQQSSLDVWINYLTSANVEYPTWLRYWVFEGVTKLRPNPKPVVDDKGLRIKGVDAFVPRRKDTVAVFPELNDEAVAMVMELIVAKYCPEYIKLLEQKADLERQIDTLSNYEKLIFSFKKKQEMLDNPNTPYHFQESILFQIQSIQQRLDRVPSQKEVRVDQLHTLTAQLHQIEQQRHKLLIGSTLNSIIDIDSIDEMLRHIDFRTLYNQAYEQLGTGPDVETLQRTTGEWITYEQGADYRLLMKSLLGHNTGWCTSSPGSASSQINSGDIYVYYSEDENGRYTIPRIAIRMVVQGGKQTIREVRGIANNQNIDPFVIDIVESKLRELPNGETYMQASKDMHMLNQVEQKHREGLALDVDELVFLYQINTSIQAFGYGLDERITDILRDRLVKKDLIKIFTQAYPDISEDNISTSDVEFNGTLDTIIHFGSLEVSDSYTQRKKVPDIVVGNFIIHIPVDLTQIKFPRKITKELRIRNNECTGKLPLPDAHSYKLQCSSLEGVIFPDIVRGDLTLIGMTTLEDVVLPTEILGSFSLYTIKSLKGVTLPKVGSALHLSDVTGLEGVTLPIQIYGCLNIDKVKIINNHTLPKSVHGDLYINGVTSLEGVTLPQIADDLWVKGLLFLPESINFEDVSGDIWIPSHLLEEATNKYPNNSFLS